jgi:hypothetical protein
MKKIILVITLALAILSVNVLAATSTASVTVPASCGLAATDVNFGSLSTGATSGDVTSTVSMPSGNTPVTPTISGTAWTGGTGMVVGQTHWYMTASQPYGTMTTLTGTGVSIGQQVSYGSPKTVYFKLQIPNDQAAASYSQTITFTASC